MHSYYSYFSSIRHPKGTEKEKKNFEVKDIESTMYFARNLLANFVVLAIIALVYSGGRCPDDPRDHD